MGLRARLFSSSLSKIDCHLLESSWISFTGARGEKGQNSCSVEIRSKFLWGDQDQNSCGGGQDQDSLRGGAGSQNSCGEEQDQGSWTSRIEGRCWEALDLILGLGVE